jgi:AraC-like DNA-binding protein
VQAVPSLELPLADVAPLIASGGQSLQLASTILFTVGAQPDQNGGRVNLADLFRALRWVATGGGEETFSLSARPLLAGTAAFVLSHATGARTIGGALRQIAHGYNLLHGADYNHVERRSGCLTYKVCDDGFPYTRPRDGVLHFALECALIFLHGCVCELAQADLSTELIQVHTRREAPRDSGAGALAFWGAPVTYGARFYALTYDAGLEDLPIRGPRAGVAPDQAVHNRILELITAAEGEGSRQILTERVRVALADGCNDQTRVAERLGISVATLRRRLGAEGVSFRAIQRQAMNNYARARILEDVDIATIAEDLGFSDRRAFTRAFKEWNGHTPSGYRATRDRLSGNVP